MNKTLFYLIMASSWILVDSPVHALPLPKTQPNYSSQGYSASNSQPQQERPAPTQTQEDVIILRSGPQLIGTLGQIPALEYPFGKLQMPVEEVKGLTISSDGGTEKIYLQTKDGSFYVGELPHEAAIELKTASGETKKVPFADIASLQLRDRRSYYRNTPRQQVYSIEFRDGTLLPIELGDFTLVLNDGQRDFTIDARTLVDVHNDRGLHGIVRAENGQYKHIPLAIVKDDSITIRLVGSQQTIDLLWKDIARIYQHNSSPTPLVAQADNYDDNKTQTEDVPDEKSPDNRLDKEVLPPPSTPKPEPDHSGPIEKQAEAYLITPMISPDGKTTFYRVVGRVPSAQQQSGATFASWPTDIVLVGEEIRYEPKKKKMGKDEDDQDDEETKDDSGEYSFAAVNEKEKKYLKANGGAVRKPLLAQCCILKDDPIIAMGQPDVKKQYVNKNTDSLQDQDGYYTAVPSKIYQEEEQDSLPHDPDLAGMVFINEEEVACASDEYKPASTEAVTAYYIDKYPVSNKQYYRFVKATNHPRPKHWLGGRIPRGQELQPIVNVSYADAQAYAKWAGKRLPTEVEWCRASHNDLIQSTTKKTLREWTATAFVTEKNNRAEKNWLSQNNKAYVDTAFRALVGGDLKSPIPQRENDIAINIGFRTALEAR